MLSGRKMHCRVAREDPNPGQTFYVTECGLKVLVSGQQLHGGTSRRMIDSLDRDLFEMRLAETRGPRPANYCSKCVTAVRGIFPEFKVSAPLPTGTKIYVPTRDGLVPQDDRPPVDVPSYGELEDIILALMSSNAGRVGRDGFFIGWTDSAEGQRVVEAAREMAERIRERQG